jgi:N-acetylglucosaminyldiphosphoundecaprenol N-acetyl-beta-D-mannosaminyltransferase
MTARISILGVAIDNLTETEAIKRIADWVASQQPHQIVTVNPEFVIEARRNPAFRRVLAAADMATPDGTGLMLAARLRRTPLHQRVTGVALTRLIAREAAARGWRVFLLGAAPGVAEQAAAVLATQYPGFVAAGCYAGSPRPADEAHIRAVVQAARPDVLLVAYGHPHQDIWLARNQPFLRVPVSMGVGGTFDEIAGIVPLAPAWMHRLGLKWLFRLATQPRRWRRILDAVPVFLWHVLTEQPSEK